MFLYKSNNVKVAKLLILQLIML